MTEDEEVLEQESYENIGTKNAIDTDLHQLRTASQNDMEICQSVGRNNISVEVEHEIFMLLLGAFIVLKVKTSGLGSVPETCQSLIRFFDRACSIWLWKGNMAYFMSN